MPKKYLYEFKLKITQKYLNVHWLIRYSVKKQYFKLNILNFKQDIGELSIIINWKRYYVQEGAQGLNYPQKTKRDMGIVELLMN